MTSSVVLLTRIDPCPRQTSLPRETTAVDDFRAPRALLFGAIFIVLKRNFILAPAVGENGVARYVRVEELR
jgi:hypothetical protein